MDVSKGTRFRTPFEDQAKWCVALGTPDEFGNFEAIDTEGVVCSFGLNMVTEIEEGD